MTDYYEVLGLSKGATKEEVKAAFDEVLAARRARRQKTGDLYAAFEVLTDPTLRRAFELSKMSGAATDRLVSTATSATEIAAEVISEIDVREMAMQAREVALKATYLGCGALARGADFTARTARSAQAAAKRKLRMG